MKVVKIGRNDTCPCGSGKKFKLCCERKAVEKSNSFTKWTAVILGSLLILGVLAMVMSLATSDRTDAHAGQVWSVEHGHWH